mmetsp:Transcript_6253/g.24369  ORF Transcript_6253/g.24369 Transcript_6253/m.24369 type:complete len:330 (-) Transcript_6253:57-1046(-)
MPSKVSAKAKSDLSGNVAAMAFNFTSAVGIILANKFVFKEFHFHFPTFMTVLHFAMTSVGVRILLSLGFFKVKRLRQMDVLPVTVSFCSFVVFNNLSLQANSVGTYQLMKVMTTPIVVLVQFLAFGVSLPLQLVITLIPICVGVALATVSDVHFSMEGLLWGALGVFATCFYQLFVKTKQSELGCSFFQLLYYQAPQAAVVVSVMTPFLDRLSGPDGVATYFQEASQEALTWIFVSAVLAFLVNLSTYLVITRTSPVTYQVLGHFKLVIILTAGVVWFNEEANSQRLLGMILALLGIILYTTLKQNMPSGWEKKQRPKVEQAIRGADKV